MRSKWTLKCPVEKVRVCCQGRREYHEERIDFWDTELKVAESELKGSGLTFEDAHVTGGHDVRAVVDNSKAQRYGECKRKLQGHKDELDEYKRWLRALEYIHGSELELDIDDVKFFGM